MGNLKKLLHFCQILVATVICGSMACDDFSDFFFVTVENKSNKDIYFLVNWRYPDTIISPFKHIMQHIPTNKKVEIYQHDPIESIFKNAHGGPIVQFIIYDYDFLYDYELNYYGTENYTCDLYKYKLDHFEYTYDELASKNWTITYP